MSGREFAVSLCAGGAMGIFVVWLCYRSAAALPLAGVIAAVYVRMKKGELGRKRQQLLHYHFRDFLSSLHVALLAGYSVENAFGEALSDMVLLYGKNSLIVRELTRIVKGLKNNVTLEKLLNDLGERSGNPDVEEFAQVFAVAKRSGGNMTQMIADTVGVIGERLTVENEIDVLLSAKRMEARIMDVVPFFIIGYVGLTSPGFFDVLYHNLTGVAVMSGCLGVWLFAWLLSEKIIAVEV
jgi:tight adherence protein B